MIATSRLSEESKRPDLVKDSARADAVIQSMEDSLVCNHGESRGSRSFRVERAPPRPWRAREAKRLNRFSTQMVGCRRFRWHRRGSPLDGRSVLCPGNPDLEVSQAKPTQ